MCPRIPVPKRSHGNIWRRGTLLPETEVRLAWESLGSEASADSAIQLGSFADWMIGKARECALPRRVRSENRSESVTAEVYELWDGQRQVDLANGN